MIFKSVKLGLSWSNHLDKSDFQKSACVFLKSSLKMLEMQISNDIQSAPFFGIGIENEDHKEESRFKDLSDIRENNTLIDSPFKQKGLMDKQTVISFVKLLDCFIDINSFSLEIIQKVLTWSKDVAAILKVIFNYAKDRDLPSLLSIIDAVWTNIKIDYKLADKSYKTVEEWNSEVLDKPVLSQSDKIIYFNFQIVLLFWWSKLEILLKENSNTIDIYQNKDLKRFISSLNKWLPKSQKISLDEIKLDQIITELFCTDFFKDISKVLLYNVVPETSVISNPQTVIGVIVGLLLANKKIIRTNLSSFLKVKDKIINGVFGIIFWDYTLEKEIKTVWKKIKIKSDLALSILNLISDSKNKSIYMSWMKIWDQYCSSAQLISALVSLLNKDLTNMRVFTDLFSVDYRLTSIVFALATKNIQMLSESYNEISKRLEINWENAVKVMVEVFWGKFDSF